MGFCAWLCVGGRRGGLWVEPRGSDTASGLDAGAIC